VVGQVAQPAVELQPLDGGGQLGADVLQQRQVLLAAAGLVAVALEHQGADDPAGGGQRHAHAALQLGVDPGLGLRVHAAAHHAHLALLDHLETEGRQVVPALELTGPRRSAQ
jgi:hypothetical protein